MGVDSEPVKLRLKTIRECLTQLNQAKSLQDGASKNPSTSKGVWISFQLWRALSRQLQSQLAEIHEWDKLLLSAQQEANAIRQQATGYEQTMLLQQRAAQKEVVSLEQQVAQQQASMYEQQRSWAKQRDDLMQQTERALKTLQEREQVAIENEQLLEALREAQAAAAQADMRAQEAEIRATAIKQQSEYFVDKSSDGRADRTALTLQIRDLSLALSHARAQLEQYRLQQSTQQLPSQQLLEDLKRLKADNERLVALLGETKAWKRVAKELSAEGGVHYVPVEQALVHKGGVGSVYSPLRDRSFELAKVSSDPDESWHWVPKQAVCAALEAVAMLTPTAPRQLLLHVLLSLNKVWRQREEKKLAAVKQEHAAELRELHRLYRQRAPYEAVVGNTRLADLKKQLRLQAAHAQQLAAAEAGSKKEALDDGKMFLALGLDSINSLNQQVARLQNRNTRLSRKLVSMHKQPALCSICTSLCSQQVPPSPDTLPFPCRTTSAPPPKQALPAAAPTSSAPPRATEPAGSSHQHTCPSMTPLAGSADLQPAPARGRVHRSPHAACAAAPAYMHELEGASTAGCLTFPQPAQPPLPAGAPAGASSQEPCFTSDAAAATASSACPQSSTLSLTRLVPEASTSGIAGGSGRRSSAGGEAPRKQLAAANAGCASGEALGFQQPPTGSAPGPGLVVEGWDQSALPMGVRVTLEGGQTPNASKARAGALAGAPQGARVEQEGPSNVAGVWQVPRAPPQESLAPSCVAGAPHASGGPAQGSGAAHMDTSTAKAASLARLISKYEQPVLRFSLWNRDGSLQAGM